MRIISLLSLILSAALLAAPVHAAKPDLIYTAIHGTPEQLKSVLLATKPETYDDVFYKDQVLALMLALKRNKIANANVIYRYGANGPSVNNYEVLTFDDKGLDRLPAGALTREVRKRAKELYHPSENKEQEDGGDELACMAGGLGSLSPEALDLVLRHEHESMCSDIMVRNYFTDAFDPSNPERDKRIINAKNRVVNKYCKE